MDKKQALKSAAYEVFSKKDTRRQEFQKLLDKLIWQSDLFYNYYESKEAIFLDIYIDENNRVRQTMIEELDWEIDMIDLISQLFAQSRALVSSNKILAEWYNPAIADELHSYYSSEEGKVTNPFHQFLVKTFTHRLQAEGHSPEKIQDILQVYNLFYYMDMHITENDFPDISKTVEILATNFIKGILK